MSTLRTEVTACPIPTPFDETEAVLVELADLESALAREVERLKQLHAPSLRRPGVLRYNGRDLWWWRVMLVTWAHSGQVEQAHSGDVLAGLKMALKQWTDRDLRAFVRRLPMSVPNLPPAA